MRAAAMTGPGELVLLDVPVPNPGPEEVLIRVGACAVCRTDLHVLDGDLAAPSYPRILGHEVVGRIEAVGSRARAERGARVGVPWLAWTCGTCDPCRAGLENLCDRGAYTGWTRDGGFAEYLVADARFVLPIPDAYDDVHAAPLLCAGLIGHRCLRAAGDARHLGLYGFGAAAHIVAQVATWEGRTVYAFTRPGDQAAQALAREQGCAWVGASGAAPPVALDAAIIFAPVGTLVPAALAAVRKGGVVVCGGIHMSDIPSFPYSLLWGERTVRSVANLTRADGQEFLRLAPRVPVRAQVQPISLGEAPAALRQLRRGDVRGAVVLVP
jgi:propanol-preferring alcohol dehydrogenase